VLVLLQTLRLRDLIPHPRSSRSPAAQTLRTGLVRRRARPDIFVRIIIPLPRPGHAPTLPRLDLLPSITTELRDVHDFLVVLCWLCRSR
jgi:hypothetical protein